MKTKEELTALKNEVELLNQKLSTLTEEELEQVSGGEDVSPVFTTYDTCVHVLSERPAL